MEGNLLLRRHQTNAGKHNMLAYYAISSVLEQAIGHDENEIG